MKEFFNSIFQTSSERMRNPVVGSFILSWIVFNWKSITTLIFSNKIIENRIDYISQNFVDIWYQLYYPLFFTVFYVLLLPYLTLGIDYILSYAKIKRKETATDEIIKDFKDKQKIAVEERIFEEAKAGNAEISELNEKISDLTKVNEEKQKTINSLKIDIDELTREKKLLEAFMNIDNQDESELTVEQIELLDNEYKEFIKTEDASYFENIAIEINQFKNVPKSINQIVIERFIMRGIIRKIDDEENQRIFYTLTRKGKHFWKNFVLSKDILSKEDWDNEHDLPF